MIRFAVGLPKKTHNKIFLKDKIENFIICKTLIFKNLFYTMNCIQVVHNPCFIFIQIH